MSLKFKYSGVKEDGTLKPLGEGFDSKGKAFVSASSSATNLRCFSNPSHFVRIVIQDDSGNVLEEYKDHKWLKCDIEE